MLKTYSKLTVLSSLFIVLLQRAAPIVQYELSAECFDTALTVARQRRASLLDLSHFLSVSELQ